MGWVAHKVPAILHAKYFTLRGCAVTGCCRVYGRHMMAAQAGVPTALGQVHGGCKAKGRGHLGGRGHDAGVDCFQALDGPLIEELHDGVGRAAHTDVRHQRQVLHLCEFIYLR